MAKAEGHIQRWTEELRECADKVRKNEEVVGNLEEKRREGELLIILVSTMWTEYNPSDQHSAYRHIH